MRALHRASSADSPWLCQLGALPQIWEAELFGYVGGLQAPAASAGLSARRPRRHLMLMKSSSCRCWPDPLLPGAAGARVTPVAAKSPKRCFCGPPPRTGAMVQAGTFRYLYYESAAGAALTRAGWPQGERRVDPAPASEMTRPALTPSVQHCWPIPSDNDASLSRLWRGPACWRRLAGLSPLPALPRIVLVQASTATLREQNRCVRRPARAGQCELGGAPLGITAPPSPDALEGPGLVARHPPFSMSHQGLFLLFLFIFHSRCSTCFPI